MRQISGSRKGVKDSALSLLRLKNAGGGASKRVNRTWNLSKTGFKYRKKARLMVRSVQNLKMRRNLSSQQIT